MIGIILAGGDSLRMGQDKATIQMPHGLTMAELTFKKLSSIGLSVYLSVNQRQSQDPAFVKDMRYITDSRDIYAAGPLVGLLSAHLQFPEDDIFVLACNMPLVKVDYLDHLFDEWLKRSHDVYVYQRGGRAEPLCGIYTHESLKVIDYLVDTSTRKNNSLQYYVQGLNTCYMPIPKSDEEVFITVNTPQQVKNIFEMAASEL